MRELCALSPEERDKRLGTNPEGMERHQKEMERKRQRLAELTAKVGSLSCSENADRRRLVVDCKDYFPDGDSTQDGKRGLTMGFFGMFGGGPFDFNGDGYTDASELALGFMVLDELEKEDEQEKRRQEFLDEFLLRAVVEGVKYTEEELQEILDKSERMGLFG